jgi:cell wall-associated NlpC family hydrolase
MKNISFRGALRPRASVLALCLASFLASGAVAAPEPGAALAPVGQVVAAPAGEAVAALPRTDSGAAPAPEGSLLGSLGQGVASTASNLGFALVDGVKTTVLGTATLVGSVTGVVGNSVKSTFNGTLNVAGAVGGALGSTVRNTVSGTTQVAGRMGSAVGGAVRTTVVGTANVAGSVTGIVADTVRSTVDGTVNVAGGVGSTVGTVARTLIDAPQRMIQYATTMLGTPYKWGGNTVDSGLDCSGFVREVVQVATGRLLPRTAREMSNQGAKVAYTEMKPGDLVFFNTRRREFSHVGIYLGDGRFMHGASGVKSGKQVRIDSFNSAYYRKRFNGARRLDHSEEIADNADYLNGLTPAVTQSIH